MGNSGVRATLANSANIPNYQDLMLPLLKYCTDNLEHNTMEVLSHLAQELALTEDQLAELQPSGHQTVFVNRFGWARTYLTKACLLEKTGRGKFKITARGLEYLKDKPKRITAKDLERFDEFLEFQKKSRSAISGVSAAAEVVEDEKLTPEDSIYSAYKEFRAALASELLDQVKECKPAFFERLVVDLLLNMGYGGSENDAGTAIGRSGDGGIDGIIKEDRLGLDSLYIQAKRWGETVVGRPEIQKFVGALHGHRARKGVFITTSRFSAEAQDYVRNIEKKIVLIDGERLAQLMIDFNVGVMPPREVIEIKRINNEYFNEE